MLQRLHQSGLGMEAISSYNVYWIQLRTHVGVIHVNKTAQ